MKDNRLTRMLEVFVKANKLQKKGDFKRHMIMYSGLRAKPLTEGELIESIEFTGFCDGCEGMPHRFEGAKGTKQLMEEDSGAGILDTLSEALTHSRVKPLFDKLVAEMGLIDSDKIYTHQFELGKSFYGKLGLERYT
jgi:hypothetical protein